MTRQEFETTGDLRIEEEIDLDRCHNKPIHQTALIQPHGLFLQFDPESLTIKACSQNVDEFLVFSAEDLLGKSLVDIFKSEEVKSLRKTISSHTFNHENFILESGGHRYIGLLFPLDNGMGLELEPYEETSRENIEILFDQNKTIQRINEIESPEQMFNRVTRSIIERCEFDRVMVLKFENAGHGHVIADSTTNRASSYLDQYFPASDIPEPARRLYRKNNLRYIPRTQYEPIPIVDGTGEITREDIDLTYSSLRSVPLIHRKYLQNMNVGCTMSVPLMVEGDLWGLITGHKMESHEVHWASRHLCIRIGRMVSSQIERFESEQREKMHLAVEEFRDQHLQLAKQGNTLFEFLGSSCDDLLDLIDASAIYMQFDQKTFWESRNNVDRPREELFNWIQDRLKEDDVLTVNSIEQSWNKEWSRSKYFSGLLAVNFTQSADNFCVWFRPEQKSRITWGGDPRSPVEIDEDEELNPRSSFDEWTQIIRGKCDPWEQASEVIAQDLLQMFNEIVLEQKSRELREANYELEAQNEELISIKETLEQKNQQLEQANEKLEELSYHDELTGVPNRRQFEQTLKSEWKLLERNQQEISLIMIDIDHFKEFNDHYGHQKGDQCLKNVATAIQECARRESDTVARYGGEEFVVILPDTTLEGAKELAEKMRHDVEKLEIPHKTSPVKEHVTISLGIAHYDNLEDKKHDQLIENADEALYEAKEDGRNRVKSLTKL